MNLIHTYIINKDKRPYLAFNFQNEIVFLHRIVAFLYIQGYKKELVVDHIDNNSLNNNISNLQYLTHTANIAKQCGKETIVVNIYNNKQLRFASKTDFFKHFSITASSLSYMINRFRELNMNLTSFLKQYREELEDTYINYLETGNDKAAGTVLNMRDMIDEGWIPARYSYH